MSAVAARRRLKLLACLALGLSWSAMPAAQGFPGRPVHIIVPFAPGGAFDALARVLGAGLESQWHQSVVVETKPGAGSVIGTTAAAGSSPDGYTLVLVANSLVINA